MNRTNPKLIAQDCIVGSMVIPKWAKRIPTKKTNVTPKESFPIFSFDKANPIVATELITMIDCTTEGVIKATFRVSTIVFIDNFATKIHILRHKNTIKKRGNFGIGSKLPLC